MDVAYPHVRTEYTPMPAAGSSDAIFRLLRYKTDLGRLGRWHRVSFEIDFDRTNERQDDRYKAGLYPGLSSALGRTRINVILAAGWSGTNHR